MGPSRRREQTGQAPVRIYIAHVRNDTGRIVGEVRELTDFVAAALREAGDPVKAAAMARYMKTADPFYGVQKPARKVILREMLQRFPIESAAVYEASVGALWEQPHREEKYLALSVASTLTKFIEFDRLDLYRNLITEGAWWDFVDEVAAKCVGQVWMQERTRTTPIMRRWVESDDLWLRRTAIIGQLKHKEATDAPTLFDFCLRRAWEPEFFIRKAIGWALREYAKTAPDRVTRFVLEYEDRLSRLSFREATKHLDL